MSPETNKPNIKPYIPTTTAATDTSPRNRHKPKLQPDAIDPTNQIRASEGEDDSNSIRRPPQQPESESKIFGSKSRRDDKAASLIRLLMNLLYKRDSSVRGGGVTTHQAESFTRNAHPPMKLNFTRTGVTSATSKASNNIKYHKFL